MCNPFKKPEAPALDQSLIAERKRIQQQQAAEEARIEAAKREDEAARRRGLRGLSSLISGDSGGAGFGTPDKLGGS